jgi:hypothetical protein
MSSSTDRRAKIQNNHQRRLGRQLLVRLFVKHIVQNRKNEQREYRRGYESADNDRCKGTRRFRTYSARERGG